MLKITGLLLVASLMTSYAFAGPSSAECKEVANELKAMQKAQQSVSDSLAGNHEVFADQMQDYSIILSTSATMGQPVTQDAVTKMTDSAKSFRERGKSAKALNKKLSNASDEVISRALACLKKQTDGSESSKRKVSAL